MPAAALIPAAIGVAGAIGSGVASAAGVGKNDARATTFGKTDAYDANRFEYGGRPGGADADANRYAGLGANAQNRNAFQTQYRNADLYANMGNEARFGQNRLAGMFEQRANGQLPSFAQMQADRQMRQATAAQSSAGASARGAAGLALAQQNAANNTATLQSGISNTAQMNEINERLGYANTALGAYTGMRSGDAQAQAQAAQQAQFQAQLEQQQREMNDRYQLGMTGFETGVRRDALNAGMTQQHIMANSLGQSQGINVGVNQANAATGMQHFQAGLGAAMGGAQGAMTAGLGGGGGGGGVGAPGAAGGITGPISGAPLQNTRARGGPVRPGEAYLVGEEGPELVVPRQYGHVIPAEQTRSIISDDRAKLHAAYIQGQVDAHGTDQGEHEGLADSSLSRAAMGAALGPMMLPHTVYQALRGAYHADSAADAKDRRREAPKKREPKSFVREDRPLIIERRMEPSTDPVTAQLAAGLAPIQFEYKPGMGPPGQRTGVRAQGLLSQPLTASAVVQRPDGMLGIDQGAGMTLGLAAAGHNARKIAEQDEKIALMYQNLQGR